MKPFRDKHFKNKLDPKAHTRQQIANKSPTNRQQI